MSFNADCLAVHLRQFRAAGHCYVAYSGGLDSHVLLHALVQLLGKEKITAIHINHQLSANADQWGQHCQHQCESLGVNLISEAVSVDSAGLGLEQAARNARYAVFEKLLQEGELLLMGHHADDQVETVLYRLLRGSGVKGLAGIPRQRKLGRGELIRPLLLYSRNQLENYARHHQLAWIEDESNFAIDFDRNFLRHQVIPAMADRWPDYTQRISHSASLCDEASQLLDEVAENDFELLSERQERLGWSIAFPELLDLPLFRRSNVLRYWASRHQQSLPGHKVLTTVERELFLARQDAAPKVSWGDTVLRRFGERIYMMPDVAVSTFHFDGVIPWNIDHWLSLPGGGSLSACPTKGGGLKIVAGSRVEVCCRQGERCRPAGRSASNTLKKLLQQTHLEPWLRDCAPLIYVNRQLVAVADLWVCEGFQAGVDESGWQLSWVPDPRFRQ